MMMYERNKTLAHPSGRRRCFAFTNYATPPRKTIKLTLDERGDLNAYCDFGPAPAERTKTRKNKCKKQ